MLIARRRANRLGGPTTNQADGVQQQIPDLLGPAVIAGRQDADLQPVNRAGSRGPGRSVGRAISPDTENLGSFGLNGSGPIAGLIIGRHEHIPSLS